MGNGLEIEEPEPSTTSCSRASSTSFHSGASLCSGSSADTPPTPSMEPKASAMPGGPATRIPVSGTRAVMRPPELHATWATARSSLSVTDGAATIHCGTTAPLAGRQVSRLAKHNSANQGVRSISENDELRNSQGDDQAEVHVRRRLRLSEWSSRPSPAARTSRCPSGHQP